MSAIPMVVMVSVFVAGNGVLPRPALNELSGGRTGFYTVAFVTRLQKPCQTLLPPAVPVAALQCARSPADNLRRDCARAARAACRFADRDTAETDERS
jgi:hypothetical protein